jgi:hypothetical protein
MRSEQNVDVIVGGRPEHEEVTMKVKKEEGASLRGHRHE